MMKVKIKTADLHFSMPVPVTMIGFVIKMIPDKLFEKVRKDVPEPYRALITKETISMALGECADILKENKGLEMVHAETADGTFVSITL